MKSAIWALLSATAMALLTACVEPPPPPISRSDIGPGIGPFDANGNYREDWADDPSKWRRPNTTARHGNPPPDANPLPPTPSHTASAKPRVTRYTVRRGDTLSAIAKRHGSSVSAIRRANGISGHLIYPGQRLVIPRR